MDESLTTIESKVVKGLQVTSNIFTRDTLASTVTTTLQAASKVALSFTQVVELASKKAVETEIQQRLISSLGPEVQTQVLASSGVYSSFVQAITDGQVVQADRLSRKFNECYQDLKATMEENIKLTAHTAEQADRMIELQAELNAMQEKMEQLQIQALGQLAVLQTRVQVVLTQTYELHEYPIPRLFVVLPQNPSVWDAANPFSNKFQLYFLCECGEHTQLVDSKNEIHFAKHEGYEIARPKEFFLQYGSHVLTILKMLKYGISVTGVIVPAISHLVRADAIDQATAFLEQLKNDIEPGMNHVIEWMDKVSVNEGEAVDEFAKQMENKEALAGADLRKLDTFLKAKDADKVLGNIYRTVTDEGHVKWVCIDHYCENYQESMVQDFQRILNSMGGSFNKSIGRVAVVLRSRVLAEQFFSALGKARSVYELDIVFDWACNTSDLELLEESLKISTSVSILQLDLRKFQTSKLLSTSSQYGVLFRFLEVPVMRAIHIVLPKEYTKRLSFQPKAASYSCKLTFELATGHIGGNEFGRLVMILKTNSTLTTLNLEDNSIGDNGAQALSEALKTNRTLVILYLQGNSIGSNGAQELSEALKSNSTLTTLNLYKNSIGSDGAKALAEALKTNLTLTTLNLGSNMIGDYGAEALSEALKTNSTLSVLEMQETSITYVGAKALFNVCDNPESIVTIK
ncbi:hypothetical protein BGZ90_007936, partial [Linnemannia elongata]